MQSNGDFALPAGFTSWDVQFHRSLGTFRKSVLHGTPHKPGLVNRAPIS
jgi:hypothetical protein